MAHPSPQSSAANESLIDRVYRQARDLTRVMGITVPDGAAEDVLQKVEKAVNQKLPPSFRHLLALQNGWQEVWQGFSLAGTNDLLGSGLFGKSLALRHAQFWKDRNIDPYDVKARKSFRPDAGKVVPWRLLVVGLGPSGDLLLFDIRQRGDDGEAPFLHVRGDGTIVAKWDSFNDWLWMVVNAER